MSSTKAITALTEYYLNLDDSAKASFQEKNGFSGNMFNLSEREARRLCKSLGIKYNRANHWAKYDQAKANWEDAYKEYHTLNKAYHKIHAAKNTSERDYNTELQLAIKENDGEAISSSEDNEIRIETGYTTNTIKSDSVAGMNADLALSKMQTCVSEQQAAYRLGASLDLLS